MIPDLESLRCFEAAARELNFRAAAARVHLSPAAFGERIRRLEEAFGTPLFQRTTRKVVLTEAGIRLLPEARRTLDQARRLVDVARADTRAPYSLTIGSRFELGLSFIVPNLQRLGLARPERTIHMAFGDTDELFEKLRLGGIDAFVSSARLTRAGLQYAPLHREDYAFVATPTLLKKEPLLRPEHAARHVLLDAHADLPLFRYFLDASPGEQVWAFSKVEQLGTIAAIRHRVLEGAGVAVLPEYFVREDISRRRLKRLFRRVTPTHDYFRMIWLEEHPLETELLALAAELRSFPLK